MLNERELHGVSRSEDIFLLWAPEAIEVMMRLPSCSSHMVLIPTNVQTAAVQVYCTCPQDMPTQHRDKQYKKKLVGELSCFLKSGLS